MTTTNPNNSPSEADAAPIVGIAPGTNHRPVPAGPPPAKKISLEITPLHARFLAMVLEQSQMVDQGGLNVTMVALKTELMGMLIPHLTDNVRLPR